MRLVSFSLVLGLVLSSAASAAEMAIGENFTVIAPSQALAEAVAAQAEVFRRQAALEWLGMELPRGAGRSLISVDIAPAKDEGSTWPIDSPQRTLHQVWLTTSVQRATGSTLHHEVVHTVLDTHFYPERLAAWASEGIASQADDAGRQADQRRIVTRWAKTGQWPALARLLECREIEHNDLNRYAAASSLVEYLVERGGRSRVLAFAAAGGKRGWDRAAAESYRCGGVARLQLDWQAWATARADK